MANQVTQTKSEAQKLTSPDRNDITKMWFSMDRNGIFGFACNEHLGYDVWMIKGVHRDLTFKVNMIRPVSNKYMGMVIIEEYTCQFETNGYCHEKSMNIKQHFRHSHLWKKMIGSFSRDPKAVYSVINNFLLF